MKQTLAIFSGLILCLSTFGTTPLTFSLSTPGPDAYADGTPVKVGEKYLLVYVRQGAEFKGVLMSGELVDSVNNVIAATGYAVEGAKCGFKAIQYSPTDYPEGGEWYVVLLDTRDASGAVGSLVAALGVRASTGAAAAESTSLSSLNGTSSSDSGTSGLSASTTSSASADTPAPVITAVERGSGTAASVCFSNFKDRTLYEIQCKTNLTSGSWVAVSGGSRVSTATVSAISGSGGVSELPVSVQVPANDPVRFFRVVVGSK